MANIKATNPWGRAGGIEPQRADLWSLDLGQVVKGLISADTAYFTDVSTTDDGLPLLPSYTSTYFYARQVVFSEYGVAEYTDAKEHVIPRSYPGYDEPVGPVRVDFLVDAGNTKADDGTIIGQQDSRIYNLIRFWHQLARIGRPMRSRMESRYAIPLSANPESIADKFKFDVPISLYAGTNLNPFSRSDIRGDLGESNPQINFYSTSGFLLRRAWVKSYQLGTLDMEGNGLLKLSATLIPEAILPSEVLTYVNLGKTVAGATF